MKSLLFCALFIVTRLPASGQTTGRIAGTVKDPSGAFVAGASVECTLAESGETRKVFTDAAGSYIAPLLTPGTFRVTVSAKGFATQTVENVTVALT
jgi:glycosyltransferase A (GT-A) superfamily protein (DUF2064 family)